MAIRITIIQKYFRELIRGEVITVQDIEIGLADIGLDTLRGEIDDAMNEYDDGFFIHGKERTKT